MRLRLVASATSATIVGGFLLYRGIQLFLRNDITLRVVEVVRLPTIDDGAGRSRGASSPTAGISIEGTIEVETRLMRSYRFVLKLAAQLSLAWSSKDSSRQLLLSKAVSSSTTLTQTSRAWEEGSECSTGRRSRHAQWTPIVVESTHDMVDRYELEISGMAKFSPACLGEEHLLAYTVPIVSLLQAMAADPASPDAASPLSSNLRDVPFTDLSPCSSTVALRTLLRGDGPASVGLRRCRLEPHHATAHAQCLTVELDFHSIVHGLQVHIALPSRRCRVVAMDGGSGSLLGNVTIAADAQHGPTKILWELGSVDQRRLRAAATAPTTSPRPRLSSTVSRLVEKAGTAAAAAATSVDGPGVISTLSELLTTVPTELANAQDCAASVSLPPATLRVIFEEVEWMLEDESSEEGSSEEDGHGRRPAAPQSGRARKRVARALKAQEQRAKIHGQAGVDSSVVPKVELTYSLQGAASGLSVRKLVAVMDEPNWLPIDRFDELLLRLCPAMQSIKLQKYAHYTTWFVQTVQVDAST